MNVCLCAGTAFRKNYSDTQSDQSAAGSVTTHNYGRLLFPLLRLLKSILSGHQATTLPSHGEAVTFQMAKDESTESGPESQDRDQRRQPRSKHPEIRRGSSNDSITKPKRALTKADVDKYALHLLGLYREAVEQITRDKGDTSGFTSDS